MRTLRPGRAGGAPARPKRATTEPSSTITNRKGHDHASENHTGHDHEEKEHDHAGEIAFTKEQAARTDFELLTVEPAPFRDVIETSGRILAAQGDEAAVAAPVSGIVSFADKKLSDGAAVSRGETLFTISSKEIAEGDYEQRIRSAYTQAETAFRRAEKLIGDRIITQTEYEQARLAYENAKTAYDALASKSSAKGTRATAPIAASSRACRSAKETTSR